MLFSSMFFAISLSIDAIGIGFTYGLKNITLSILCRCILFLILVFVSTIAILIGEYISSFLSETILKYIGVGIFCFMGISSVVQVLLESSKRCFVLDNEYALSRSFKEIMPSKKEHFSLGLVIAISALCEGIGIYTFGINSLYFPVFMAIFHLLFLFIGYYLGKKIIGINIFSTNIGKLLPGLLLIGIGIFRIFN